MTFQFLSKKTVNKILLTFKHKISLINEILDIIYIYLYTDPHRDEFNEFKNKDFRYLII